MTHFLASHIARQGKPGSGRSSHLSSSACEELIDLMAQTVLAEMIREIKKSVYHSISIDSTPDISQVDQLAIVVRYVNDQGPVERFLTFLGLDVGGHTGAALEKRVPDYLFSIGIDIAKCRGRTYDNAANMSGLSNGVRAHIEAVNSLATNIPCAAHSLNLVGSSAANCCSAVRFFFNFVQKLYSFLAARHNVRVCCKSISLLRFRFPNSCQILGGRVEVMPRMYYQWDTLEFDLLWKRWGSSAHKARELLLLPKCWVC